MLSKRYEPTKVRLPLYKSPIFRSLTVTYLVSRVFGRVLHDGRKLKKECFQHAWLAQSVEALTTNLIW